MSGEPGPASGPPALAGLVVVDKQPGWTSHDVVARCRRIYGLRRVGHAGTLDPDATGVLLVGLGRATRLLRFLTALPKTYTVEIVLGVATTTLDSGGEVVGEWDMGDVTLARARAAAASLTGPIDQVPPMVSAVKIGGQPLHRLARRGIEVDRPARRVTVHRFEVEEAGPGLLRAVIDCSSGTYVRVLAADLGTALGGGAHVRHLRRTAVGSFDEAEALPVDALGLAAVRSPAEAVRHLDAVVVPADLVPLVGRGVPLERGPLETGGEGPWALLDGTGSLLAVYEASPGGRMRPAVVLAGS